MLDRLKKVGKKIYKNHRDPSLSYAKVSFSQEGEDILVGELFKKVKRGFYVEIGAYHPFQISNTFAFYRKGWKGIVVDPNPQCIELFEKYRPRDIFVHAAVGNVIEKEMVKYFMFDSGEFNTTTPENVEDNVLIHKKKITGELMVPCMSLSHILNEHSKEFVDIQVLSIDTEGSELQILKSNDWKRFRPQCIIVEIRERDLEAVLQSKVYQFLKIRGYVLVGKTGLNGVFLNTLL